MTLIETSRVVGLWQSKHDVSCVCKSVKHSRKWSAVSMPAIGKKSACIIMIVNFKIGKESGQNMIEFEFSTEVEATHLYSSLSSGLVKA